MARVDFLTARRRFLPWRAFYQPQQVQYFHHGSTKTYLCFPLLPIPFFSTMKMAICGVHVMASVRDLVAALLTEVLLTLFFAWMLHNMFEMAGNKV